MAIVAGVDFGTLSVRVSIVDSARGMLRFSDCGIPYSSPPGTIRRSPHSLLGTTCARSQKSRAWWCREAGINGDQVEAIALDTTDSTVIPIEDNLVPLDEYYLRGDHRVKEEAAEITSLGIRITSR